MKKINVAIITQNNINFINLISDVFDIRIFHPTNKISFDFAENGRKEINLFHVHNGESLRGIKWDYFFCYPPYPKDFNFFENHIKMRGGIEIITRSQLKEL